MQAGKSSSGSSFLASVVFVAIVFLCVISSNTPPPPILPLLKETKFRTRTTSKVIVLFKCKYINQLDATTSQVYYLTFMYSSTCFGHPHVHHQ